LFEQVLLVSEDTEGVMESEEGSLFVGALSAQTSLFWTWLLWRRVKMICQVWLMWKSQEWGVLRELPKSVSSSICPRMMMSGSMSTPTVGLSQPKMVKFLPDSLWITLLHSFGFEKWSWRISYLVFITYNILSPISKLEFVKITCYYYMGRIWSVKLYC